MRGGQSALPMGTSVSLIDLTAIRAIARPPMGTLLRGGQSALPMSTSVFLVYRKRLIEKNTDR